jgi:hypothetical protein
MKSDMALTKSGRVPANTLDRWLRWRWPKERIASAEKELAQYPHDRALKREIERLKRRKDCWHVPDGFSSWEALEAKLN